MKILRVLSLSLLSFSLSTSCSVLATTQTRETSGEVLIANPSEQVTPDTKNETSKNTNSTRTITENLSQVSSILSNYTSYKTVPTETIVASHQNILCKMFFDLWTTKETTTLTKTDLDKIKEITKSLEKLKEDMLNIPKTTVYIPEYPLFPSFYCPQCNTIHIGQEKFTAHIKEEHTEKYQHTSPHKDPVTYHICICDYSFSTEEELTKHIANEHTPFFAIADLAVSSISEEYRPQLIASVVDKELAERLNSLREINYRFNYEGEDSTYSSSASITTAKLPEEIYKQVVTIFNSLSPQEQIFILASWYLTPFYLLA